MFFTCNYFETTIQTTFISILLMAIFSTDIKITLTLSVKSIDKMQFHIPYKHMCIAGCINVSNARDTQRITSALVVAYPFLLRLINYISKNIVLRNSRT